MSRCALSSDHYGPVEESVTGAREWALGTEGLVMRWRLVVFLISDNPCRDFRISRDVGWGCLWDFPLLRPLLTSRAKEMTFTRCEGWKWRMEGENVVWYFTSSFISLHQWWQLKTSCLDDLRAAHHMNMWANCLSRGTQFHSLASLGAWVIHVLFIQMT